MQQQGFDVQVLTSPGSQLDAFMVEEGYSVMGLRCLDQLRRCMIW